MLTTAQEDILKELYNVFVGEAANLLSEIIQKRIILSVPEVNLLTLNDLSIVEQANLDLILNGTILSTSLQFGNTFSGSAEFVFPTDQIKYVSALCMGEEYDPSLQREPFDDTDFDIVKEIGNIILNSIMGGMANIIDIKLEYDVPQVMLYESAEYGSSFFNANDSHLLLLYVNFSIDDSQVIGLILIKFSFESVEFLLNKVDEISRDLDE